MYTGQCLCGGIQFEIDGVLEPIQICYCKQCQRAQGAPLATNIPVAVSAFRLLHGQDLLRAFESSPGKQRCFCGTCGSPIYSKRESLPNVLRIRAGLVDGELATKPIAHFHTGAKPNWWTIHDDLPQFAEGYVPNRMAATPMATTVERCAMLSKSSLMAFLATSNAQRTVAFYRDVLGLTLVANEPYALVLDANGTMLRISKVDKPVIAPYTALGWVVNDIATAITQLQARGVVFERFDGMGQDELGVMRFPSGARVAWFKDPEGQLLSLTQMN